MQLLEPMAEEGAGEGDRERRAMKQFVYTVRGQNLAFQHPQ
jgi:hypothetical protein